MFAEGNYEIAKTNRSYNGSRSAEIPMGEYMISAYPDDKYALVCIRVDITPEQAKALKGHILNIEYAKKDAELQEIGKELDALENE